MQQRVITVILLIGLFFSLITLGSGMMAWRLPDREQGYAPEQPIAYSHRVHAGELGIDCRFCHWAAEQGRYAGIPSSNICMKCHNIVTSSFAVLQDEMNKADEKKRKPRQIISDKLRTFYDTLGLDDTLKPAEGAKAKSIPWVRVHNLPDYVYFNHSAHMSVGITCQRCHGPVESMERLRQFESLSMGWCVDCHRQSTKDGINGRAVNAATHCAVCHY